MCKSTGQSTRNPTCPLTNNPTGQSIHLPTGPSTHNPTGLSMNSLTTAESATKDSTIGSRSAKKRTTRAHTMSRSQTPLHSSSKSVTPPSTVISGQESSQQLASKFLPDSEQESTQESTQMSIRTPAQVSSAWEAVSKHNDVSLAWDAIGEQASSWCNIRPTFPQPPEDMSNSGNTCSIGTSMLSRLSSLSSYHLSESDIDAITALCCARRVTQDSLQHSLWFVYNLPPEVIEILV